MYPSSRTRASRCTFSARRTATKARSLCRRRDEHALLAQPHQRTAFLKLAQHALYRALLRALLARPTWPRAESLLRTFQTLPGLVLHIRQVLTLEAVAKGMASLQPLPSTSGGASDLAQLAGALSLGGVTFDSVLTIIGPSLQMRASRSHCSRALVSIPVLQLEQTEVGGRPKSELSRV